MMPAANYLNHSTVHAWPHRRFTRFDTEMEATPTGALTHDITSWNTTVWTLMFVLPFRAWDDLLEDKQVTEEITYFCVAVPGDCIHMRKLTILHVPTPFLHETAMNDSLSLTCREREREREDIGFAVINVDFQTAGRDRTWFARLPVTWIRQLTALRGNACSLIVLGISIRACQACEYCPGRIVGVQGNPTESNRQLKN
jgi:hypothetical protein